MGLDSTGGRAGNDRRQQRCPCVDRYGGAVRLKPGQLSSGENRKMDLDIVRFGKEHVIAEISFTVGVAQEESASTLYRNLVDLLKKKGLLAGKQSTKTQYYLDYFAKKREQ